MGLEHYKEAGELIRKLVAERQKLIKMVSEADDPASAHQSHLDKIVRLQVYIEQLRNVQKEEHTAR